MPIYEFLCGECGHRFEELVAAGTETNACPACGTASAKRIMSSPSATPKLAKTAAQNRRLEDKRGVTRGGALERFKQSRKAGGPRSGSSGKGES